MDILFVNPNSSAENYQELANKYSAIEVPVWSLLLAQSCRVKGYSVGILDCDAERLNDATAIQRIKDINPRLVCFVCYGQNPNAGTTNMVGVYRLAAKLREDKYYPTISIGSHTSSLPYEVLSYEGIDFVAINEGVYVLHKLLDTDLKTDLHKIPALGYIDNNTICLNDGPNSLVPQDRMDIDLPGYAWDLLPFKSKPLDMYRSHVWHRDYNEDLRSPFAALYTSLGCRFKCNFCMINILNRTSIEENTHAGHHNMMRFWSPDLIIKEFDKLAEMGVETIRISDEMFFLDKRYYAPLIDMLIERDYTISTWTYARVDTVQEKYLEKFRKAGVNYLGIGIEAADQVIRQEITKGKFKEINIRDVVKTIENHGINVGANYIFGFPNENIEHLQKTLDLAIELNTAYANFYCATALPGSPLYFEAKQNGWPFPETLDGYGFLAYNHVPPGTHFLAPRDVLKFRDEAWHKYYERPEYLNMIESKFGIAPRKNIEELCKIKLKRKLLEN